MHISFVTIIFEYLELFWVFIHVSLVHSNVAEALIVVSTYTYLICKYLSEFVYSSFEFVCIPY